MRATLMYGAGDVRLEDVPDPKLEEPTDAVVRVLRSCICGSDLHPYHSMPASEHGTQMGHEFLGVVEELGSEVIGLKKRDLVVASFAFQARQREPADVVAERGEEGIAKVRQLSGGDGTHTVLEAVGYKEAYEQALSVVRWLPRHDRPRGTEDAHPLLKESP
jgi:threonine dehydrogenase-like Zn-dependent dehydrogenase